MILKKFYGTQGAGLFLFPVPGQQMRLATTVRRAAGADTSCCRTSSYRGRLEKALPQCKARCSSLRRMSVGRNIHFVVYCLLNILQTLSLMGGMRTVRCIPSTDVLTLLSPHGFCVHRENQTIRQVPIFASVLCKPLRAAPGGLQNLRRYARVGGSQSEFFL